MYRYSKILSNLKLIFNNLKAKKQYFKKLIPLTFAGSLMFGGIVL